MKKMGDKKKADLLMILGKPGKMEKDEHKDSDSSEEKEMAAEDVLNALKAKDAKLLAEALENFLELC